MLLLAPIVVWAACLWAGGFPNVPAKVIVEVLQNSAVQKIYNESHICNLKLSSSYFKKIKNKHVELILIILV